MAMARMTKISDKSFMDMEGSGLSLPCKILRRELDASKDSVYIYLTCAGEQLHVFYATSINDVLDIYNPGTANDWWLAIQAGV